VHDVRTFEIMAEIGVILLMFSVGIEFSIPELLKVKWVALLGAPAGILVSVGWAWESAHCWVGHCCKVSPSAASFPSPAPW
jgi:predicted Kef-type K+ transport protein